MATVTETLESMFFEYGGESESACASFATVFVFSKITEENVREVLAFVVSKPMLNRMFWRAVNSAPRTEEEWQSSVLICGGGEEMQRKMKERDRRAVELVRSTLSHVQQRREALFRRDT